MNYEEEFALYKHISKMADAYVPLETILKKHGATADSALHEAKQYRADFFSELESLAVPADHLQFKFDDYRPEAKSTNAFYWIN